MKYAGDDQFETLVVLVCQRLLAIAAQPLTTERHDGREMSSRRE